MSSAYNAPRSSDWASHAAMSAQNASLMIPTLMQILCLGDRLSLLPQRLLKALDVGQKFDDLACPPTCSTSRLVDQAQLWARIDLDRHYSRSSRFSTSFLQAEMAVRGRRQPDKSFVDEVEPRSSCAGHIGEGDAPGGTTVSTTWSVRRSARFAPANVGAQLLGDRS